MRSPVDPSRPPAAACAVLWLLAALPAAAQTSVPVGVGAEIPETVEVLITGVGGPFSPALGETALRDVRVADIEVSSNGSNGFQVRITSLNDGLLLRDGGTPTRDADVVPYRLDLEDEPGGSLGTELPAPQERRGLDLSGGTESIRFDDNVVGPTVQKLFVLEIQTEAKSGLFAGTYSDTVTITVEDL